MTALVQLRRKRTRECVLPCFQILQESQESELGGQDTNQRVPPYIDFAKTRQQANLCRNAASQGVSRQQQSTCADVSAKVFFFAA